MADITETIGSKPTQNSGVYSGKAFKEAAATADYADNIYDFGFKPEMIYIEHVSGTGDLDVDFFHGLNQESGQADVPVDNNKVFCRIEPSTSRLFRKRNHQYLAFKSSDAFFRVEAW